ncbi:MAG: Swt1 family HEPN domain-containing protein, partial [Syntrophobacteraceae bacterium]
MKSTWASGAIELLRHADSHLNLNTAFDKRIAFISIDNSVETIIRSYLSLPKSKSGVKVDRKELDEAGNSFPRLLNLLEKYATAKLIGVDVADIEHYHRIRNTLYHEGTGLSVDDQYIMAYRGIAAVLLGNLFDVNAGLPTAEHSSLERLILNWNQIERIVRERVEPAGYSVSHRWEDPFVANLSASEAELVSNLRSARNRLVHSESIDKKDVGRWVEESERLLRKLSETAESKSAVTLDISYSKKRITPELHRYSLVVSVTLNRPPDQGFFRLSVLWPLCVEMHAQGLKFEEEKIVDGVRYAEFSLFVEERLWPGQTMKIIGSKNTPQLEYSVDGKTFEKLHDQP